MHFNLVISATYKQYKDWIIRNGLSVHDYQYIGDLEKLRGISDSDIYLVGEYWKSPLFRSPEFKHRNNCRGLIIHYENEIAETGKESS